VAALPFQPILNSFGLAWGLVLFAVLLALALAFGLRRLTDDVFAEAPAAAACPLEEPRR
jgi:ABC-type spermidine/putrescine transport system permease subunit II